MMGARETSDGQRANALVFAAGLGTRLRPITDTIPKALVTIAGKPLLHYILKKLHSCGFGNIVVNAHHHAAQIEDYLRGSDVKVSLEEQLLDTGGGLKKAMPLFENDSAILIHNVDILSNADLRAFYDSLHTGDDVLLLVSDRPSSRRLLFDDELRMVGWADMGTGEVRSPYTALDIDKCHKYAFAGIHCVTQHISALMEGYAERFSIIDFYIEQCQKLTIRARFQEGLELIDVGKTESLSRAEEFLRQHGE